MTMKVFVPLVVLAVWTFSAHGGDESQDTQSFKKRVLSAFNFYGAEELGFQALRDRVASAFTFYEVKEGEESNDALVRREDRVWRLAVSGRMRFGIDSSVRMKTGNVMRFVPSVEAARYQSRSSAEQAAKGGEDGVLRFDNGFIDPRDSAGIDGETWNWRLNDAADVSGGTLNFRSQFEEVSVSSEMGSFHGRGGDEETPGVSIELLRNLWHDDRYGVDVSVGFSWYDALRILKASGNVFNQTVTRSTGSVEWGVSGPDYFNIDGIMSDIVNADGSIGAGKYEGPGPVINVPDLDGIQPSVIVQNRVDVTKLLLHASGEMSMLELQLALQPYMRVWDDLYLRGKAGLAVIYTDVSIDASLYNNGSRVWRESQSSDDFAFCGVLGLSAEYFFTDWLVLSLGAEMYLGDNETDINGRLVSGKVGSGDWAAAIGLTFMW